MEGDNTLLWDADISRCASSLFKLASYLFNSFTTCISWLVVARTIAAVIIAPSDELDLKSLGTSESSVADRLIPVLFSPASATY